ncbi:hypothetical protein ACFFRC_36940 [Amycolatopsis halotolerans]
MSRSGSRTAIFASATAVLLSMCVAQSASAADSVAPPPADVPAMTAAETVVLSAAPDNARGFGAQNVINCPIRANYPHRSQHIPGFVAGESTTSCPVPVPSVATQAELYRWLPGFGWALAGIGQYKYGPGTYVTSAANDICQGGSAYYYTLGHHSVVFPKGYTPQSASGTTKSPVIRVNC